MPTTASTNHTKEMTKKKNRNTKTVLPDAVPHTIATSRANAAIAASPSFAAPPLVAMEARKVFATSFTPMSTRCVVSSETCLASGSSLASGAQGVWNDRDMAEGGRAGGRKRIVCLIQMRACARVCVSL